MRRSIKVSMMSSVDRADVRLQERISSQSISPEFSARVSPTSSASSDKSSPNVIKALELLQGRRDLSYLTEWNITLLRPSEYNELVRQIEQNDKLRNYFENQVR